MRIPYFIAYTNLKIGMGSHIFLSENPNKIYHYTVFLLGGI